MTHKNPSLKQATPVKAKTISDFLPSTDPGITSQAKPTKFTLEGNRWIIENFVGNHQIVIEKVELRHSVYIFNCHNCTIHVKGKLNQVSLGNSQSYYLLKARLMILSIFFHRLL